MKKLSLFIIPLFIFSCGQHSEDNIAYNMAGDISNEMIPITRQDKTASPPPENIENTAINKQKIIKDGRMGIRVDKLGEAKAGTDSLVKVFGGYYSSENYNNMDYELSYSLNIRIPNPNFEKFISQLESGGGEVIHKSIDARDVTDQFIDLEARLENKKQYLDRYRQLLKRANTVKEILEIEEKIRGIEEEIESTTGRFKYLSDQVDYSTLDLQLSEKKEFKYQPRKRDKFIERLKQSLSKGWFGFVDFVLFLLKLWPFWVLLVMGIYLWQKRKRKKS